MSKKRSKDKRRSTKDATKRRQAEHKTGFDPTAFELPEGVSLFGLKNDKAVRLDIIPYVVGEGNPYADEGQLHWELTYYVHRGIGADQNSYVCLKKTVGQKCPICDHRAKLMKDPDADEDLIKDLAPKQRQLFNVIDLKDRDKGIQIWDISFHLFGKKLDARLRNADEDDRYEDFAELDSGFTLKLGVEEKSFGGRNFYEVDSIDFKPRKEEYEDSLADDAAILEDVLKILDYDELKAIFLQTESDGDEKKSSKKEEPKDEDDSENTGESDEWKKGDRIKTDVEGETYEGVIKKINDDDEEALVTFDDGDEWEVPLDDLELVESKKESSKKGKKDKDVPECPHGGTFGKDTDELDDDACDDCPLYDECDDA